MGGCVFCGGGPVTKEHVLPKWLRDLVPDTRGNYLIGITDDPDQQQGWSAWDELLASP